MSVLTPELYTQTQRDHYQVLLRKNLPSCVSGHRLFENAECALSFIQAFFKYRCEHPRDDWSLARVFRKIRAQAALMTTAQCTAYIDIALGYFRKNRINLGSIALPFSTVAEDSRYAVRMVHLLLSALLTPEIGVAKTADRSLPLRYIILMPKAIGTWHWFMRQIAVRDSAALSELERFIRFATLTGAELHFVPDTAFPLPGDNPSWSQLGPALQDLLRPASAGVSDIPVPSDCVPICRSVFQEMLTRYQRRALEIVDQLQNFRAREDEYRERMKEMWKDILYSAGWGLRPEGQDVVHIGSPELLRQGLRDIQFFQQPDVFGHVVARFWMRVDDSDLEIRVDRDIQSGCDLVPFTEDLDPFFSAVQKFHRYLAVYGLWRILTGRISRVASEHSGNGNGNGNGRIYRLPPRPHYPRLPAGKRATARAFERAAEMNRNPPPAGRTFARSDLVAPIEVNPRQRPILVLTDEDLQLRA